MEQSFLTKTADMASIKKKYDNMALRYVGIPNIVL